MDPLEELRRKDKWFLGAGSALLWAPPFPTYLDWPGFWDEAHYLDYTLDRAFTVALVDEQQKALPLKPLSREWRPSELTTAWMAGELLLSERKAVLPQDVLVSELTIWNPTDQPQRLTAVVHTQQRSVPSSGEEVVADVQFDGQAFRYMKRRKVQLRGRELPVFSYRVMLGADRPPRSFSAQLSEWNSFRPEWELTPFAEQLTSDGLPRELRLAGVDNDGVVYLGMDYPLEIPPEGRVRLSIGCAVEAELGQLLLQPVELSQQSWQEYFEGLPVLETDDAYLERYWWYRWYGLRLNAISNPGPMQPHPFVAEGIAQFRNHISYSAQCHVLECRWLPNSDLAEGSVLNFAEHQASDGRLPGNIYSQLVNLDDMYHSNWGWVIRELYAVDPSEEFLKAVYPAMLRYAQFLQRRDTEGSHLFDVVNQGETGQEYMSRYQAVDPKADQWGPFRLKGVDATVYAYELHKSLAWMATTLGHAADAKHWSAEAELTRKAIISRMWDPVLEMFSDVNPETGQRTGVKTAVGFYPFMSDIAEKQHVVALQRHLLNPQEFWTAYPVPATAANDTYFTAMPDWKGKRTSCPWNGRVWPMSNSHVCEALARASQKLDAELKPSAAELIQRFIRLMFRDGDIGQPNCFEHYNPSTGYPSVYRGIDDYQHSWVVDLLIRYLAGVQPDVDGGLTIDPLPFAVKRFTLSNLRIRGHNTSVEWSEDTGFRVSLDGAVAHESVKRERVNLRLS